MALLAPAGGHDAVTAEEWVRGFGGAESNVAINLVRLGVPAAWVSKVGADAFGQALVAELDGHGVDVADVRVDPERPTGLYVKEPGAHGTAVRYYRAGSAASAMGPELASIVDSGCDWVHLTGITPALSPNCLDLVRGLLRDDRDYGVSFDVNYRPTLRPAQDPEVLLALARRADLVFVGDDEAKALWGKEDVDAIRALLPVPTLVIKHGARGATVLDDRPHFVPALRVDVVEPVGAGDAFAAGFLAARLSDRPVEHCLRAGHLTAASALCTVRDVGALLPSAGTKKLMYATDEEWSGALVTADEVRFG
jgi:2-dehydro-3-deoxygluconokinase